MFGLAAAPEIATAVPIVIPPGPPYKRLSRYPRVGFPDPEWSGVTENASPFRSCQASSFPATRFRVVLMMWNGRPLPHGRMYFGAYALSRISRFLTERSGSAPTAGA